MKLTATLLAVGSLFTVSTAPAQAHTTSIDGRNVAVYKPLARERGRVILLHGFTGDETFYRTAPANHILYRLRKRGYQVLTPALPYSGPRQGAKLRKRLTTDADGGAGYLATWRTYFDHITAWADRHYGRSRTLVGGISWGGYNAMQAACSSQRVAGWFAISPVVDPAQLGELAPVDTHALGLDRCATRLAKLPGRLSYGDADTRVGVAPTQRLAALLRGPLVSVRRYHGLGHTTTLPAISRVANWAAGFRLL